MDIVEESEKLYHEYSSVLRPLIIKIESVKEKVPENLFEKIALMFDGFSLAIDEGEKGRLDKAEEHLKEAIQSRDEAFIICYKTLINEAHERVSRCLEGHTDVELNMLAIPLKDKLNDARVNARLARIESEPKIESYRRAYELYESLADFLDNNPKIEATSKNLKREKMVYFWVMVVFVPILLGVLKMVFFS